MITAEHILECLHLMGTHYTGDGLPLLITQYDNKNELYTVGVSVVLYENLVLVSHYFPLSVGDAIPDFDRMLIERNRLIQNARYERDPDPKADEYRVRASLNLDGNFNCNTFIAAMLDVRKLMNYRQNDRDKAIDPPPRTARS